MIQKSLRRPRNWNRPGPSTQGRKPRDGRWPRENELPLHLRSSVDRFAELQFFLRFCQARSAKTVPRLHGRNGLADMPVARGSLTPIRRFPDLRLESRGRGLLPDLMRRRLFFGRKTHWCVDDNAKSNYNRRPYRCGRSSLARLFSRADRGHGPSVFTLLSDGLARLRPLEGATS